MAKKQPASPAGAKGGPNAAGKKRPVYEPPKLMKFEKLERLIVSGE